MPRTELLHAVAKPALRAAKTYYRPVLSELQWIVPGATLPPGVEVAAANNNVAVTLFGRRLFMAFRSAPHHFASRRARLYVISSDDLGATWTLETELRTGRDLREPLFFVLNGELFFRFFEGGKNPVRFQPRRVLQMTRSKDGEWRGPVEVGDPREVHWEVKVRYGCAWLMSYRGSPSALGRPDIEVLFRVSRDGVSWSPVNPKQPVIYRGGVSEVGFEFDELGTVWAVGRNEDGDASGWGAVLMCAPRVGSGTWEVPPFSDPHRYDSPRMIEHAGEIYMIARRNLDGPYDKRIWFLPFQMQRLVNLAAYSLTPKRTALYRIDRQEKRILHVLDFPSAGDTAFPSIVPLGPHRFLIANYSSPLCRPKMPWVQGQMSRRGTGIYFIELSFTTELGPE